MIRIEKIEYFTYHNVKIYNCYKNVLGDTYEKYANKMVRGNWRFLIFSNFFVKNNKFYKN